MKANELMIGDWVRKLESGGHTIPVRVTGIIDEDSSVLFERRDCVHGVTDIKAFEPIPITTGILAKNGFEELMSEGEKVAEAFGRKPQPTGVWMYCFGEFDSVSYVPDKKLLRIKFMMGYATDLYPIRHVHELQHALRQCGVDLEIEL